jgi:hypothetical protein
MWTVAGAFCSTRRSLPSYTRWKVHLSSRAANSALSAPTSGRLPRDRRHRTRGPASGPIFVNHTGSFPRPSGACISRSWKSPASQTSYRPFSRGDGPTLLLRCQSSDSELVFELLLRICFCQESRYLVAVERKKRPARLVSDRTTSSSLLTCGSAF